MCQGSELSWTLPPSVVMMVVPYEDQGVSSGQVIALQHPSEFVQEYATKCSGQVKIV